MSETQLLKTYNLFQTFIKTKKKQNNTIITQ